MKKLITILTIMVVLASAVFAVDGNATKAASAGNAAIDITASVTAMYPIFQMKVDSGATADVTSRLVNSANENYTFQAGTTSAQEKAALTSVTSLLTAQGTATVVFNLNQVSDSRCTAAYDLSVTASDLVLVKSEAGATNGVNRTLIDSLNADGTAKNTVLTEEKFEKESVTVESSTLTDTAADGKMTNNVSNNTLRADYNGKPITTTELTIGTATVVWNANVNAKSGDYEARVILTVTAI